jgi:hypothetical protein
MSIRKTPLHCGICHMPFWPVGRESTCKGIACRKEYARRWKQKYQDEYRKGKRRRKFKKVTEREQ